MSHTSIYCKKNFQIYKKESIP